MIPRVPISNATGLTLIQSLDSRNVLLIQIEIVDGRILPYPARILGFWNHDDTLLQHPSQYHLCCSLPMLYGYFCNDWVTEFLSSSQRTIGLNGNALSLAVLDNLLLLIPWMELDLIHGWLDSDILALHQTLDVCRCKVADPDTLHFLFTQRVLQAKPS